MQPKITTCTLGLATVVGASLSEPLLDELAGAFLWYIYIYIYLYRARVVSCINGTDIRMFIMAGLYARGLQSKLLITSLSE